MARPVVHAATEELYASIGSGLTREDEVAGWHLLLFLDAAGALLGAVDDKLGAPAWAKVFDPDLADPDDLPFLGQFTGTVVDRSATIAEQRSQVKTAGAWDVGRPAALIDEVKRTLTGTKTVYVNERAGGSAWRLTVQTKVSETPNQAATLAAILRQKPGAIELGYRVSNLLTYGALDAKHATYADMKAAYGTYADMRDAAA